ncbi:DNA methyltransferase [Corynebacterium sp. HMSC062E11]|nr:DNA methyltransferase [Corynebacterium sp. HMSC062E11]
MNPYYQDDYVTLYHADCLQHLDMLDQADVMVTDPPYGVDYTGFGGRRGEPKRNSGRISINGDSSLLVRDTVLQAWSKPAIVFGSWRQPRPLNTRHRLIWSKGTDPGMGDLTLPWGNSDEEIYVIGKGFIGVRGPNILIYPKPPSSNRPDHPTPKPVPLMEKLIIACPEHWVIVDPFAGSGSTLRAAKNLGRKAIGFEIEEKYCEITAQRCAQETLGIFQ